MSDRSPRNSDENAQFVDRRKKADWVTKAASILSVVAWVIAIAMLLLLERAQPQQSNLFTNLLGVTIQSSWNTSLLRIAFILLVAALGVCTIAMIFNALRNRRKTDKYKKSIIILGSITLVGIVLFLYRFGAYL